MSPTPNTSFNVPAVYALFLIAILSTSTGTLAQNAYKCGSTYSAVPCPGGVAVDTQDVRTNAQKIQTDVATTKTAKAADSLEKSRLTQERADAKARVDSIGAGATVISPPNPASDGNDPSGKVDAKKKKNTPEYFTAQAPSEKKEKVKKAKKVAEKTSKTKKAATTSKEAASKT